MGEGLAVGLDRMEDDLVKAGKQSSTVTLRGAEDGSTNGAGGIDRQTNQTDRSSNITIENMNFTSPEPLDEKKVRQENEKMLRELAVKYAMGR